MILLMWGFSSHFLWLLINSNVAADVCLKHGCGIDFALKLDLRGGAFFISYWQLLPSPVGGRVGLEIHLLCRWDLSELLSFFSYSKFPWYFLLLHLKFLDGVHTFIIKTDLAHSFPSAWSPKHHHGCLNHMQKRRENNFYIQAYI